METTLTGLLYALGSAPMFAARPFLAAFVTCLLARFGDDVPWLRDHQVIVTLSHVPSWFTSNVALSIFGALTALEVASAKSPEIRSFMRELDGVVKSAVAMLVSLAVLDADSEKVLKTIDKLGVLSWTGSAVVAGTTFVCAKIRNELVDLISDVDEDDDVGMQSVFAWAENTWTVFGILLLVLLPLFAVVLSALTTLALWWLERRAKAREEASKVACANCQTRIFPHATRCHSCGAGVATPRRVGVFGQPKEAVAADVALHRLELAARKRCPDCATRLRKREVRQRCEVCGRTTFASQRELESYLAALQARLPRTLAIAFALSAIPLVGVIPGVVYYRLTLISGLRGYIPPLRGCLTKWLVRFVNFGLVALQPIPVLGALIIPLMCATNYWVYRSSLAREARDELAALPAETMPT